MNWNWLGIKDSVPRQLKNTGKNPFYFNCVVLKYRFPFGKEHHKKHLFLEKKQRLLFFITMKGGFDENSFCKC
jgi:hypothetical protein